MNFISQYYPGKDINHLLIGEKTPENLISLDVINILFPNAKLIVMLRHPYGIYGAKKERFSLDIGAFTRLMSSQFTSIYLYINQ